MPGTVVILLLAVWVGAIAVLVRVNRAAKLLELPALLAAAGVFTAMLPLAISPNVAVAANGAILILFMISLGILKPKHRVTVRVRETSRSIKAAL
jgi:hypothetical protein